MTPSVPFLRAFLPVWVGVALHAGTAGAQPASPGSISEASDPAAVALKPSLEPAPKYELPPPSARWNLLFTGLAVTGVSYGLAVGASYAWPDEPMSNELRIPVVGPWMAIADTGCKDGDPNCSTAMLVITGILAGMDGVLQAGGLGLAIESIFMPTASPKARASTKPTVRPVPIVAGRDALGLGVVGTF